MKKIVLLPLLIAGILSGSCAHSKTAIDQTTNKSAEDTAAIAFPGAEGFGKYTTGGRGGKVFIVTNLNDNGPGSLRQAVNAKGPRIVVFGVSGTIKLQSKLTIKNGDITLAGQTAPGDGICLRDYTMGVNADNVIIRYMRFRLGPDQHQEDDAINGRGHSNIIIDHCSASWSVDECMSFYYNKNITIQWCLVAESLNASVHVKGEHGYGGIWGGEGASFHHNLFANNKSRNPRFSGSSTTNNPIDELVDFTNNVVFNWGINSVYGGEKGRYNMVNNYYKAGPATGNKVRSRIVNPSAPYGKFYVEGNYVDGDKNISGNNWNGGVQCDDPAATKADKAFAVVALNTQTAEAAYTSVINSAGASLHRDAIDKRIIENVKSGRATDGAHGTGIIDSPQDVGGWPELASLPAPKDTDMDGMPDDWEKANGLDATKASDGVAFKLSKQYTNIEVYINSLVK